jgi:tetratricopeptide (TPR) repeat protein
MGNSRSSKLSQANDLCDNGKYDEAVTVLDSIIEEYPDDAYVWCNKGAVLSGCKKHEQAVPCFKKSMTLDSTFLDAQEGLALAYMFLNQNEAAIEAATAALALGSQGGLMYHVKGNSYSRLKKFEESVMAFDQYLLIDPHHVSTLYNKGIVLSMAQRTNQALMCFDKVLSLQPDHIKTIISKGTLLVDISDEKAMQCFERALEIDSKSHSAIYSKALMLIKLNRAEDALDFCERGLRSEVIVSKYYKANELVPTPTAPGVVSLGDDPIQRILIAKGRALTVLRRYDEAIAAFDEAMMLFSKESSLHYHKAEALRLLGRDAEAENCYQEARLLDPSFDVYKGRNTVRSPK